MNLIPRSFLLDDFFGDVSKFKIHDMKCDIYEENNNYVVEMDVPGYSKDEIDIEVDRGYLTISLSRNSEDEVSDKNYIRKERVYGTTKRQLKEVIGELSNNFNVIKNSASKIRTLSKKFCFKDKDII